jgi:hypothetical protein
VKLAEKLNPATIRLLIALLSAVFVDLCERGLAASNPARGLPESIMRMMRSTHDPRTTPFLEKLDDLRRVYLELPEPFNVAFAIGALAAYVPARCSRCAGRMWTSPSAACTSASR